MKHGIAMLVFLLSSSAYCEPSKDLIAGSIKFDSSLSMVQVGEIGKQLTNEDPNFVSMLVVGSGPKQFSLHFQYKAKTHPARTEEFEGYKVRLRKLAGSHFTGWSISSAVEILK